MATLHDTTIVSLLSPYLSTDSLPNDLIPRLSAYLDLLLKWNARTNLTAIRDPEQIVQRHFGESLFTAEHLGEPLPNNLLDLGSGAGFPGLPVALLHAEIRVTLAESQNKKASFLREVVRTLELPNVDIWAARAEMMPPERIFHTVAFRAVDDMAAAIAGGAPRAANQLVLLTTLPPALPEGFAALAPVPIPNTNSTILLRAKRA